MAMEANWLFLVISGGSMACWCEHVGQLDPSEVEAFF